MKLKSKTLREVKNELALFGNENITSNTKWSLYQTFAHCAKTIDYSISGYPSMKPAIIRNTIGKIVIGKFLRQGYMHHNLIADVEGSPVIEDIGTMEEGIQLLVDSIKRFEESSGMLKPHLLFGTLSKEQYDTYFTMHIADHFEEIAKIL